MSPRQPIKFYRFRLSGHSHRVQMFLSMLGLPVEIVDVDLGKGQHKTPEFLAMNRFGQVPVIDDNGLVIADSNAILVYLAMAYDPDRSWYPDDPSSAAKVQRWLSIAAGPLQAGPAQARLVGIFNANHDLARCQTIAQGLFAVMDAHLAAQGGVFVGDRETIADIALYSYSALAPEGHIALEPYSAVQRWLHRIEALPGFVGMTRTEPRFGLQSAE